MIDRDKIHGLLAQLRLYTGYLGQLSDRSLDTLLTDPLAIGSVRYYLQISIETCLNIANHIISSEGYRAPTDYKDTFQILTEHDLYPQDFAQTLKELAGLRNLLVHIYWEVDDRMILESIRSELDDFDRFARCIVDFITPHSKRSLEE